MTTRLNAQAALETACFSAFGVLLLYVVGSGKYLNYVTPKMAPYLCFTAVVMLVWMGSRFCQIFRPQYKTRAAHCLILVLPAFLLLLPLGPITSASLSSGYSAALNGKSDTSAAAFSGASDSGSSSTAGENPVQAVSSATDDSGSQNANSTTSSAGAGTDAQSGGSLLEQYGLSLSKDGAIEVSDDQFYPWLSEIYSNMDRYEGKTITIKGFVYEDAKEMNANQFVPARMLMYCCAADVVPCGILCEYDKVSALKAGTWVTVVGTIHIKKEQDEKQPVVTVTRVVPANPPAEQYVYPW